MNDSFFGPVAVCKTKKLTQKLTWLLMHNCTVQKQDLGFTAAHKSI